MKYPFTILPKKSSSPTMLIKCKDPRGKWIICKVWNADDPSLETQGLEYENKVYEKKVAPLLDKNPKEPFIKYHGYGEMNGEKLAHFIGINEANFPEEEEDEYIEDIDIALDYWQVCCIFFTRDPEMEYDWEKLKNYDVPYDYREMFSLDQMDFKFITLEYIECNTFTDCIRNYGTKDFLKVLKQVIEGIYILYKNKVVHNDLHSGNILITKKRNVKIFDYDRSYMKGINNPQLNSKQCEDLCSFSQCNIYKEDGYATDFYKMLSYCSQREDFGVILDKFGITNSTGDEIKSRFFGKGDKYTKIQNFFLRSMDDFFRKINNDRKCTYLQFPDSDMNYIKSQFGTIDQIYKNTKDKARFGRTSVIGNAIIPIKTNLVRKNTEANVSTKDKPIKKSKPLPKPKSIADIILKNNLRKFGKAKKFNMKNITL